MGYVPALGFQALTPLYDPLIRWTMREDVWKQRLVTQLALAPALRVLDLGCGTGTLALMIARACPGASVAGLDGDPGVLAIAAHKVAEAGATIDLHEGLAWAPPLACESFDRVVSSLVFHHLATADKHRALAAAFDLLRPGGELHLADWGEARSLLMRAAFLGVQLLDGFASTEDNARGLLVPFMWEAGFVDVEETHREATIFGTLSLYRATKPGTGAAVPPACEPSSG